MAKSNSKLSRHILCQGKLPQISTALSVCEDANRSDGRPTEKACLGILIRDHQGDNSSGLLEFRNLEKAVPYNFEVRKE